MCVTVVCCYQVALRSNLVVLCECHKFDLLLRNRGRTICHQVDFEGSGEWILLSFSQITQWAVCSFTVLTVDLFAYFWLNEFWLNLNFVGQFTLGYMDILNTPWVLHFKEMHYFSAAEKVLCLSVIFSPFVSWKIFGKVEVKHRTS